MPADIQDLNPIFRSKLDQLTAALAKAGITANVDSGYRDYGLQAKLYADYQAKQAGKPLPYPDVGSGNIAAPPGQSFHNYGLAADLRTGNAADYARIAQLAQQFGLTDIPGDVGHIQMGGGQLGDVLASMNLRPGAGSTGSGSGESPMAMIERLESGGKNVPQSIIDANTAKGTPAGGYLQIIDPTWAQYAPKAGVDLKAYPFAMMAPQAVQEQVASAIPVNQWGPNTVKALQAAFPGIDISKPLGEAQKAYGTTLNTTPVASGGPQGPQGGQQQQPWQQGLQKAAKTLGGGDQGGQDDRPPEMRMPPMQPAMAAGGPMMIGPGGMNAMGQRAAQQALAEQGYMMSPMPANMLPSGGTQSPVQAAPPGSATGMPAQGLPGTSLNSPSALQMAMLYGMPPYYGAQQQQQFGSY